VNVSPELLLVEAEGILRSGEENIDKSPPEIMNMIRRMVETTIKDEMLALIAGVTGVLTEAGLRQQTMIQQVVERAIEDALTKAGLIGRKGVA
jgi:hypothetical protein